MDACNFMSKAHFLEHGDFKPALLILVTLDKDFGELAIVKGQPYSGIIRLMRFRVAEMAVAIDQILSSHSEKLTDGAIIVATPSKTRIRGVS